MACTYSTLLIISFSIQNFGFDEVQSLFFSSVAVFGVIFKNPLLNQCCLVMAYPCHSLITSLPLDAGFSRLFLCFLCLRPNVKAISPRCTGSRWWKVPDLDTSVCACAHPCVHTHTHTLLHLCLFLYVIYIYWRPWVCGSILFLFSILYFTPSFHQWKPGSPGSLAFLHILPRYAKNARPWPLFTHGVSQNWVFSEHSWKIR